MAFQNSVRVEKVSLRERVGQILKSAIILGEMEQGVVYSAPVLATSFGVSATPVREAMIDLVRDGLVEIVPNKGFRVKEVEESDLQEITQLRLLIEPAVVAQVTAIVPDGDFDELERRARAIVDCASRGDLVQYMITDRDFHMQLLGYARNERLSKYVSELREHTRLLGISALFERGELEEIAREHLAIVETMRRRDADEVERLMRAHISQASGRWAKP